MIFKEINMYVNKKARNEKNAEFFIAYLDKNGTNKFALIIMFQLESLLIFAEVNFAI